MDIAAYIIELLQRHEVAVVPGLGSFHTSRVEGYYNKEQQLFYPPCLQAQFSTEKQEGTDLAELISERRQISAASSVYFIEKFVTSLKEQITTESVPLGNMGIFTMRRNELSFEPNSLNESYELFYGLAPAKLKRSNAFRQQAIEEATAAEESAKARSPFFTAPRPVEPPAPIEETTFEVKPEPIAESEPVTEAEPIVALPVIDEAVVATHAPDEPVIATPPVQTIYTPEPDTEEEVEVEETGKKGVSLLLIFSLIIVFLGIGIIAVYKYNPDLLSRITPPTQKPAPAKSPYKKSATDSMRDELQAQHDSADTKPDTAAPKQINPATVSTTAIIDTFGVVIATLRTAKSAEIEAQRYIKKGFPQAEVRKKPNSERLYLINIGTYFNADSAKANRLKLLKDLHLTTNQISIQKYPYKKP